MTDHRPRLGGVSILTVTPLDARGRLAEKDFAKLLEFVAKPVIEGESPRSVTVCGEMGEGYSLTRDDRARSISLAKESLKGKAVIAAVFALSVRDAVEQSELCAKAGADALLVAPVAPFIYSARALEVFYSELGRAVPLPTIGYVNKMFKAVLPGADVVKAVYGVPTVAGIKDSTGDKAFIELLIKERPEGKVMIHTVSSNALWGVQAGADGLMVGTSNLAPESALGVWVYGKKGDTAKAQAAQDRLLRAAALYKIANDPGTSSKDWVVVKEALAQLGVISQEGKQPALPYEALGAADCAKVGELVAKL